MKFTATVAIWESDNWFVAKCIENSVASQGKTMKEAMANLKEALEGHYEDGDVLPVSQDVFVTKLEVVL